MRIVRVGNLAQYFTSNELSGWPDGIRYSYTPPQRRRIKLVEEVQDTTPPPKAVKVTSGELARMI